MKTPLSSTLTLKNLGIDTYTEAIIYIHKNSPICRAEGFTVQARLNVSLGNKTLIATLNMLESDLLSPCEASLSTYAWHFLKAKTGDKITITHAKPVDSVSYIRSKIYGHALSEKEMTAIVNDILGGCLSDIHLAMFLTASAKKGLNKSETLYLTRAMLESGKILSWPNKLVVDKHCIGGIPGNRTTLIIVPIVAAFGLMIPKTSSRAITSPAGTADTMEVFAPVNLSLDTMRHVIEQENGCIVWGGSVSLSPADDLLIRVERIMDLDSEGQMVASILSKKISAGSTHLVVDIPIGPTAKVRSVEDAHAIKNALEHIAQAFSMTIHTLFSDGHQPIGRGIGPALEARDILAVLKNDPHAPENLRDHALTLAGMILEFAPHVAIGTGKLIAENLLTSGKALEKFEAICRAQGGFFEIPAAHYTRTITAPHAGIVTTINNRYLAQLAKLAGAPHYKASGIEILIKLGASVQKDQPLMVVHSEARGELDYALSFLEQRHDTIVIKDRP